MTTTDPSRETVESVIDDWPTTSMGQSQRPRETARKMVEKYGTPDEVTPTRLAWYDNGPWKRTEVFKDGPEHRFPAPHVDHLYQAIDYQVPPEAHDELARFDGSVHAHRTEGELMAACHMEAANVLAINLAHDVVTGEKTPEEAREAYAGAYAKHMAGNPPQSTQSFQFPLPDGDQRDPDVTILADEVGRKALPLGIAGAALGGALLLLLRRRRKQSTPESRQEPDRDQGRRTPTSR